MMSLGEGDVRDCKKLAKITELELIEQFDDKKIPTVEDVQDTVEKVLMRNGYENVAKCYILYRRNHEKIRNVKETLKSILILRTGALKKMPPLPTRWAA